MLEIPILDGRYRITADSMSYTVSIRKVTDPTKSPRWHELKAKGKSPKPRADYRELAYFRDIDGAVEYIINREARLSDVHTLSEFIETYRSLKYTILDTVKSAV